MKKMIVFLALLFTITPHLAAKEIYVTPSSGQAYLFLGVVSYDPDKKVYQRELLNLKSGAITQIDKDKLQQSDELTPEDFLKTINENGLYFNATGSTPNWYADITDKTLKISLPGESTQEMAIKINIDEKPMDRVFLLTFQSDDLHTFGVIRMLGGEPACLINNDGETYFEVFINVQSNVIKGCARLAKNR